MKAQKTKHSTLKTIVLVCGLLIVSYSAKSQDKFCFTPSEMDEWIKSAINEKAYKRAYDSALTIIKSDSLTIKDFIVLDGKSQVYSKKLEKTIRKRSFAVYLWQGITGVIGSAFAYRELQRATK